MVHKNIATTKLMICIDTVPAAEFWEFLTI